jgi:DNA ligase 1
MLFSKFSSYLKEIEQTDSRLLMTEQLSVLFKESEASEIDKISYLSLGRLAPKFIGIELQLAEKMMVRAIASASRVSTGKVMESFKEVGDLGEVFQKFTTADPNLIKDSNLSVSVVYKELVSIAKQSGQEVRRERFKGWYAYFSQLMA